MSHVAKVDVEITNLEDLTTACSRLGLEVVLGQKTYRWWGRASSAESAPEGFTVEDLGHCEHAIRILPTTVEAMRQKCIADNGDDSLFCQPYEVGIVRRRDGRPGYTLLWDSFCEGEGLQDFIGANATKLKQAYGITAATRTMRAQGFTVKEVQQANGSIRLSCTK